MAKPDVVPERLKSPINTKIISLIIGAAIAFQTILYFISNTDFVDYPVYAVSLVNPLAASIASFVVAYRYKGTHVFGKAYFSLACAYLMVFFAELTYLFYDFIFEIDPYPSIADVFFFALYPFTLAHLILNTRFFKPSINKSDKIWIAAIPILIIVIYAIASFNEMEEANFDFYYGLIFTAGSAVTLGFAIMGAKVFRQGILGTAWLVLVIGILANTIGDVWYYYLEIFGGYDLIHPVNLFWYTSYWIIVYALIKHRSVI